MTALRALLANETRLFFRDPAIAFWCLVFPVGLLVIFGLVPMFSDPALGSDGRTLLFGYVPTIALMSVAFLAFTALPTTVGTYRERLVLKRLATTPVGRGRIIIAQLLLNALIGVGMVLLVYAVAAIAFDVPLPDNIPGAALAFLVGMLAALAIGLLIAATVASAKAAQGIGTLVWFPMMFFAGLWVPIVVMPDALASIARYTPLGAASQAMESAMAGGWPSPVLYLVCLGWAAVATVAAVRFFRWQ